MDTYWVHWKDLLVANCSESLLFPTLHKSLQSSEEKKEEKETTTLLRELGFSS
jgi:hypothetical protein